CKAVHLLPIILCKLTEACRAEEEIKSSQCKYVSSASCYLADGVSFEVRRYDAAKYAAVSSEGRTFDQVTGELVRKLLMYIGGSNEQGKLIRITAPIIITVYPRNDGVLSRRLVVGIRIPTIYQQSPPTPTDSAVRIEERPGMTVYALYVSCKYVDVYRKQYFCCSYDPPLKPYGRRNEVWFLQEEP
uniref:Heme-binding protein 1 n=1 Tax=Lates calcarifer TaxID=8187 RepID=A0A4W6DLV2_LATCA